jgi:hypothetical protein
MSFKSSISIAHEYVWWSVKVCVCLSVCLSTGVNRGMKFHLLKSQIFLCCVSVCSFSWQICINPSNRESFQGRWATMANLLGPVFFHNPIWGGCCAIAFLVHYLPTKTSTLFFFWSSSMRSWSWISNADMHKRKAATGVGSWAFHLTGQWEACIWALVGFSHHLVSW